MRVPEEPVYIDLFRKNPVFTSLYLKYHVHVVPPLMLLVERLLPVTKTLLFAVLSPAHHHPAYALVVKPLQLGVQSFHVAIYSLSCALLFYCYRIKIK
jgi:hypothetical protein